MGNCGCDQYRHHAMEAIGRAWLDTGITSNDITNARETLEKWGMCPADAIVIALSMESIESAAQLLSGETCRYSDSARTH